MGQRLIAGMNEWMVFGSRIWHPPQIFFEGRMT